MELEVSPEPLFRKFLFQHLNEEPGVTILPGLRPIDYHGMRGLSGMRVIP